MHSVGCKGVNYVSICISSLHLTLIECCESQSTFCNSFLSGKTAPLIPFIQCEQHFMYSLLCCRLWPLPSKGESFFCLAPTNHYFCTCFVKLNKKNNMLCSISCVCSIFFFSSHAIVVIIIKQQRALVSQWLAARRLKKCGVTVFVFHVHPGNVDSDWYSVVKLCTTDWVTQVCQSFWNLLLYMN